MKTSIVNSFLFLNIGEAKVQEMFQVTDEKKKVNVAGCCCLQGVLQKSAIYDVIRREEIIYTGN